MQQILADDEFGRGSLSSSSWQIPTEWIWGIVILLLVFVLSMAVARWYLKQKVEPEKIPVAQPKRALLEAQKYAEKGNYRLAFRYLFLELLSLLGRKRKLLLDRSKTNGEYREEIKRTWPEEANSFAAISLRFDEVWYGQKSASSEEYQRYYAWYQKVNQNEDK